MARIKKIILFGILGALGCLAGWVVGELFLFLALPASTNPVGSLATKPVLPDLAQSAALKAPPPPAPVFGAGLTRSSVPGAPPASLIRVGTSTSTAPKPPPPPAISGGSKAGPAPPPPEFAQRLQLAGARSGDVQVTLIWFNVNDLDLHCVDPFGEEIYFRNRKSGSGGELDVDMNAKGPETSRPVENIYWPLGKAPLGKYKVYANYYANHGGRDPSDYKVNVLVNNRRQEFTGSISRNQPKRFITEFEVAPPAPELRLAVSPEIVVPQGGTNELRIGLARPNLPGPVRIWIDGDMNGITAKELTVRDTETEAILELSATDTARTGERVLTARASAGAVTADSSLKLIVRAPEPALRLAVSPELTVFSGGRNQLKVAIARTGFDGVVRCQLGGDLTGIGPSQFEIAAGASQADIAISADDRVPIGMRQVTVRASAARVEATASFRLIVNSPPPELRLAVSRELIVNPGVGNVLQVRIARTNLAGPVRLRIEGDLRGITCKEASLGEAEEGTIIPVEANASTPLGERTLTVVAGSAGPQTKATFQLKVQEVPPTLRLALPLELQLHETGRNDLPLRIARDRFAGPVTVRLEGDLTGVSPREFVIPADRDEWTVPIAASQAAPGTRTVRFQASGHGAQAESTLQLVVLRSAGVGSFSWNMVVIIGLWTTLVAAGLALALVMGQNRYLARPLLSVGEAAAVIVGSLLAGVIAGGLGQALYGLLTQARLLPEIGFLIGWLLLGGLLGRGLVFFVPNLPRRPATIAGACGGILAAVAFIMVSAIGDTAGRLTGAAILGFAIGLMVAIVESAFRRVWLEVSFGPRHLCTVNLGATPVFLGGDGRKCTVLVPGAPGRALKFWESDGQGYCLDVVAEKTFPVSPGYRHRLKDAEIRVCSTGVQKHEPGPRSSPPILQSIPVKPTQPVQAVPALAPDACPVCGDRATGTVGKRRCENCSTVF